MSTSFPNLSIDDLFLLFQTVVHRCPRVFNRVHRDPILGKRVTLSFQQTLCLEQLFHLHIVVSLILSNCFNRVDQLNTLIQIARIDGFRLQIVPMLTRESDDGEERDNEEYLGDILMKFCGDSLNDLTEFTQKILMPVVVFHSDLRLNLGEIDDQRTKGFVRLLRVQGLPRFSRLNIHDLIDSRLNSFT